MSNPYIESVGALAAGILRARAERRKAEAVKREPVSPAEQKRKHRDLLARQAKLAATTFPNNLGNYKGKRVPKPRGQPMTPRQLFAQLVSAYVLFRTRTYARA